MALEDRLFTFLSHDAAGLAIAAVPIAIGVAGLTLVRDAMVAQMALAALVIVGLVLAAGACVQVAKRGRLRKTYPPPGVMVKVAGGKMHLLAEGPAGTPTIVWLSGGHVGGFALHHLHSTLKTTTRSVLLDRFGTGWSDAGPFPRTTAREADEVLRALECAGEPGPFVFAGHSFGGLLAANCARRYPSRTHAVALIDPTPLDVVAFGPRLAALKAMRQQSLHAGWLALFGLDARARVEAKQRSDPAFAHVMDAVERALGEEGRTHRAVEGSTPGAWFAAASIYRELVPHGLADRAWDTVVYDGDLGDLPVYLIAPQETGEVATLDEMKSAEAVEQARIVSFFAHCRERYLAISTRSTRVVAPADSGHNFPYLVPGFLVDAMRAIVHGDAPV